MIGQTISHYKIRRKLGQGGMGEVYLAQDTTLPRKVALKFLSQEIKQNETARKRFLREAELSAAIDHPYICNTFEMGEADGQTFLALEYVDGPTLADRLADGPLPLTEVLKTAAEIAEALGEAHAKGILHRDLKPSNIMYTSTGHVKIVDFGLAKPIDPETQSGPGKAGPEQSGETLTAVGLAIGTPYYMSPEQMLGGPLDVRSDIFSLGVLLYKMATASLPFKATGIGELFNQILNQSPALPSTLNPEIPAELDRIIKRAMEKDQDRRYQSAGELLAELRRLRTEIDSGQFALTGKVSRTARIPLLAGLMACALAVLLAWITYPSWLPGDPPLTPQAGLPNHQQVTFTGEPLSPAISPDGQSVAFVSGNRIMLRDISGGQSIELLRGRDFHEIRWFPTGSELLTAATLEDGTWGTFVIPRLGGSVRRIGLARIFCWSPDGSQIAVAASTSKGFRLIESRTGEITRTGVSGDLTLDGANWQWLYSLDWSKPLDRLLIDTALPDGKAAIWTVRPDGTELTKIYEDTSRLGSPRWAPDGSGIYSLCRRQHSRTDQDRCFSQPGRDLPGQSLNGRVTDLHNHSRTQVHHGFSGREPPTLHPDTGVLEPVVGGDR